MKKMVVFPSLAFSALAVGSASAGTGKATTLMIKDLPDWPGKEGTVEIVDFAPGEVSQPHRHNADLFVYVLEGSVVTQVKGGSPKTVHAGEVFYESPTDIHTVSRNASETQSAKLLVFYLKAKGAPPTVVIRRESSASPQGEECRIGFQAAEPLKGFRIAAKTLDVDASGEPRKARMRRLLLGRPEPRKPRGLSPPGRQRATSVDARRKPTPSLRSTTMARVGQRPRDDRPR